MVRAAIVAVSAVGVAALGACGGDKPKTPSTSSPPTSVIAGSSTSSLQGPTTTMAGQVATPAPPPSPLPAGCTAPAADTKFSSGVATVDITSGPGTGRLDLAMQPRSRSGYRASNGELKGEWEDAALRLLYINVSGDDPCKPNPSAFVRIEVEDLAFIDSTRNRCTVELKAFTAAGVDGSFTCTQLAGGGGKLIDARGTFALRP